MAKSQSLVMAGRNCDDSVFLIFFIKQINKTRYSFDINNIQKILKNNQKKQAKSHPPAMIVSKSFCAAP